MIGHGTKFPRKMEQAVAALLTARNQEEAAQSVGISLKTLQRWQDCSRPPSRR
jgi:transposase